MTSPPATNFVLRLMGGDFGPAVVVEGAVAACREFSLESVLVGDKSAIEREITRLRAQDLPVTVRHASQVVGMAESPSQAMRRKRDSSLRVAAELVKEGECRALVSAGNTGAAMAKSVEEKVKEIIVEQLGVDEEDVNPNAKFIEDLGADSLDTVELVMALEEHFDIQIPDEDAEKIVTVGDAVQYIKDNS